MSIKNQRTLFISAFAIIAVTVMGLIGLNYTVEKISELKTPSLAMVEPPRSSDDMVGSDRVKNPFNKQGQETHPGKAPRGFDDRAPPQFRPDKRQVPPPPPPDGLRRVRGGKDAPDLQRNSPPGKGPRDEPGNIDRRPPPFPPGDHYPPPPFMPDGRMPSPEEQERFRQEMEQHPELFYPPGPPPGFYPPPGFGGPDDGYNGPDDSYDYYENDYDYDSGLEGRNRDSRSDTHKTAGLDEDFEFVAEDEEDPDYGLEDEYINDHEE